MKLGSGHIQRSMGEGVSDRSIGIGDVVQVQTDKGVQHEGKLVDVTGDSLVLDIIGDFKSLPIGRITTIEKVK